MGCFWGDLRNAVCETLEEILTSPLHYAGQGGILQVGIETSNVFAPVPIPDGELTMISAYKYDTLIVVDGKAYISSVNLGSPGTEFVYTGLDNVSDISTGGNGNPFYFIISNGTIYSMGSNSSGQLGLGDKVDRTSFESTGVSATSVAAGGTHVLALVGGVVYGAGENGNGQLGLGNTTDQVSFTSSGQSASIIEAGSAHSVIVSSGQLYASGNNQLGAFGFTTASWMSSVFLASGLHGVTALAASDYATLAISNGVIFSTGRNYGRLGLGHTSEVQLFTSTGVSGATDVRMVSYASLALVSGVVYSTGSNGNGLLGLGDEVTRTSFTSTNRNASAIEGCGLYSLIME